MLNIEKSKNILIFYTIFFLSALTTVIFETNYLLHTLIITIPSILFLFSKMDSKYRKQYIVEAIAISIPISIVINVVAIINKSWYTTTILPWKFLNLMPYEDFLWGFFFLLIILAFYSYFFDKHKTYNSEVFKSPWVITYYLLLIVFLIVFNLNPNLLVLNFYYFWLLLFTLIVVVIFTLPQKRILAKSIVSTLYLLPAFIIWEITALEIKIWGFEIGQHIQYISLFSKYTIPIEELIWFIIVVMSGIVLHEYFIDNKKN